MNICLLDVGWLVYLILAISFITTIVRNKYWFKSAMLEVTIFGQYISFNIVVYSVTPDIGFGMAVLITSVCVVSGFIMQGIIGFSIRDVIKYWENKK